MKKILIVHTGGTIAMEEEAESGSIAIAKSNPLQEMHQHLESIASISVDHFSNVPSSHITHEHMLQLAKIIDNKISLEGFDGVVITHGTDTLEETAYMLDLLIDTSAPIVLTGAMRSSNELGADGPHNFVTSVRVAASEEAKGLGVLVVFNDEIHAAKHVTKTHTSNFAAFESPFFGPIGTVTKQRIMIQYVPKKSESYSVESIDKNVFLLKAHTGMDGTLIEMIDETGIDGLVIEAFGQGNLPPMMIPALEKLIDHRVPVVIVSRCLGGIVQDAYDYPGGGKRLLKMGAIFSNGLTGQKARLKLMVALQKTNDPKQLQEIFNR